MNDYDEDDDAWLADDEGNLTPEVARSLKSEEQSVLPSGVKQILSFVIWAIVALVLLSVICNATPRPAKVGQALEESVESVATTT